jgi:predicted RNase H-like nuclease (RuvC/YqgF family)
VTAEPAGLTAAPAEPEERPSQPHTPSPSHTAPGKNDDSLGREERGGDDHLFDAESFDEETVALLRAEIEDLQAALAQRDEQIESLAAESDSAQLAIDDPLDDGQTDALLARLQDLLNEAECHDERVACLEDLLQAAEEANQAEQEERAQLEAWVGDIERRIGEREAEWNAEMEALRRQAQQAFDERDRVQHQLKHVATEGSAPAAYEETLERLQQQNKSLQDELEAARKENVNLTQRIERSENQQEEVLREERAAIAQERAEISRLKFELQRKMTEPESLPQPKDHHPDREFSDRLRTLREHLREIHEEEKHEREQQRNDSALSSRIARLWKRLES